MSMTKRIHVTDLREVSALKLTCRKCGAAEWLMLDQVVSVAECPFCRAEWPTRNLTNMASAMRALNDSDQTSLRVEIETALDSESSGA